MNQRLFELYTNLKIQNKDSFLNNRLELDIDWGSETWGVTFQIDLDSQARDALCRIQDELDLLEPGNFLLLPRAYQHISVNQVIFWNGDYVKGKKETWREIEAEFLQRAGELNLRQRSFPITFKELLATKSGIIWCAYDEADEMEKLRELLFQKLPFPFETTKKNHIVHTTVARYRKLLNDPQKVWDYLNSVNPKSTMSVNKLILRKELVYPSIKTKTIAELRLT